MPSKKSLDAYKFGLLHNKQLFIRQLKHNNLGVRTIDEGGMDEGSGMNFSEYVAVLSGNTDLLEKGAPRKRRSRGWRASVRRSCAASRRAAASWNIRSGRSKNSTTRSGASKKDLEAFRSRAELNEDGSYRNRITLDGWRATTRSSSATTEPYRKTVDTGSGEKRIGSIYGFEIIVKSEKSMKEDFESIRNRFYVRGEGEYLYQYNYGNLAGDPHGGAQPSARAGYDRTDAGEIPQERASLEKDAPAPADHRGHMAQRSRPRGFEKEMERLDQSRYNSRSKPRRQRP